MKRNPIKNIRLDTRVKNQLVAAALQTADYLFESGEFGRVLNVAQVGVLTHQLLRDAFELWMLRGQDQTRVVAQLTQVLQRLKEWT